MKEYTITVQDGIETTVLLSDEDAKARGLTGGKAQHPANKSQQPANKSASTHKTPGAKGDA